MPESLNFVPQHSYGYDLAGNITSRDGVTYSFDNANKYSSSSSGGFAQYDGDGDLTNLHFNALPYQTYTWNDVSQLTRYTTPSYPHALNEVYDGFGRRVYRFDPLDSTGGSQAYFIYDGDLLIGETTSAGAGAAYTWGAAGLVSERRMSSGTSYWYHFGPQGETRQLTNSGGTVVSSYSYTAYGVLTSGTADPTVNPFLYGGQFGYYTDYGALILCGARWYDPQQGRWLSRDPIDYDGGANLYEYCTSDPVNLSDPFGNDGESIWELVDNVLDVGSLLPGAELVDAVHALTHVVRGNWAQAAGYGASALPGVHEISDAAKACRLFRNGEKVLHAASEVEHLAKPGEDLFVGTYKASRKANRLSGKAATHTPHHVVQDAVSSAAHRNGITINLAKDIHEQTATYKRLRKGLSKRQHLAADIKDLRALLRKNGYDRATINRQLKELIRQNKQLGGFGK